MKTWIKRLAAFLLGLALLAATVACSREAPEEANRYDEYPIETSVLEYCARTTATQLWVPQLDYLRDRPAQIADYGNGQVRIDMEVPQPDAPEYRDFIEVRYFAGPADDPSCTFGLLRHQASFKPESELDKVVTFIVNDQEVKPSDPAAPECRSDLPPSFKKNELTGVVETTLVCNT